MKFLIIQSSPFSRPFLSLRSTYSPQHPVIIYLYIYIYIFFSPLSVGDQESHPYRTTRKIMIFCILIFKFLERRLENDSEGIGSRDSQNVIFSCNLICYSCSQIHELFHILKVFISCQQVVILSSILVTRHNRIVAFSVFTSRPNTSRVSSVMVFMFSLSILTSSAYTRS